MESAIPPEYDPEVQMRESLIRQRESIMRIQDETERARQLEKLDLIESGSLWP